MLNKALAVAIIDSGKKKKTIARLARMRPNELSKILHGERPGTDTQRKNLAKVLHRSEADLWPDDHAMASSEPREAAAS